MTTTPGRRAFANAISLIDPLQWTPTLWRCAFDPERNAILLVAGGKSGGSQRRFCRALIAKADARYDGHLAYLRRKGSKL